jgi:hypothetical protein
LYYKNNPKMKCRKNYKSSANRQHIPKGQERKFVQSGGEELDGDTRSFMESRFGHDFSQVRVHTGPEDADSAKALSAQAYTLGSDIVFGAGKYAPDQNEGRELLAHELTHVVQQTDGSAGVSNAMSSQESQADQAANAVLQDGPIPALNSTGGPVLQRKVELRDVPKGGQSGFARLPELITRLNHISQGLTFSIKHGELAYEKRPGSNPNDFETKMMGFIDEGPVIPLIITNHMGLGGNRQTGFGGNVVFDSYDEGYVDIDDLLASDDLSLETLMIHFLTERSATANYAQRIAPGAHLPNAEFQTGHNLGLVAEAQVIGDFFGDNSFVFDHAGPQPISRTFRNNRGDRVIVRHDTKGWLDIYTAHVLTRDGRTLTVQEYKKLLEEEKVSEQKRSERLHGATEYREGGKSVPAP